MSPWEGLSPATCLPDACFCEAVGDGLIRQPSNTWSSLGFCVAALVMTGQWRTERARGSLTSAEALTFIVAVMLVGVTSAVYHASLTFFGQTLDVQSMYLVVLLALMVNVEALRRPPASRALQFYVLVNLALGVLLVTVPAVRRHAFGLALGGVIVTEALLRTKRLRRHGLQFLLGALVTQALAFGIWVLDLKKLVCEPHSLLQGHAAWHLLGAVATLLLWRSLRA
ncbi:MAG: ceramidase [Archangiaceae bacterium]|nr:ceramidase [Archangiaceae bacterium]